MVPLARPRRRVDRRGRSRPPGRRSSRPSPDSALISTRRMASTSTSLAALAALLRDGENVISPYVRDTEEEPALGALAASGPRPPRRADEYTLLVEAIREGYLLHYEEPEADRGGRRRPAAARRRLPLRPRLERLARGRPRRGAELADLISLSAQVHAESGDGSARTRSPAPSGSRRRSPSARVHAEARAGEGGPPPRRARCRRSMLRSAAETARQAGMGDALALAADSIGFAAKDLPNRG